MPSWRLVTGTCVTFFGGLLAVAGISYAMVGVPDIAKTAQAQNNVYYWADGSQMVATGGETNRQIIKYADIPKAMRYAVMSAENKTFETDKGVDPMGIARALFNMAKGGETQGGSTITQQYVKNAMLNDQSQTISRKFKELFVAIKVGQTVPKDQVMAGYLNSAYYGRGAYGIQAAARAYYNTDASKLNPSQCALLAATLKGATYYDPAGSPEIDPVNATEAKNHARAEARWSWILDQEVKNKWLSPQERAQYTKFPEPGAPHANSRLGGQIGYLVHLANVDILKSVPGMTRQKLELGGYEVHTTFDKSLVNKLQKSVQSVYDKNIDPKRVVNGKHTDTNVQFGGASIDTSTGAIKAIYGGKDATKHYMNNADVTGAQVGSTFKAFVLAAAMKYGVRDPDLGPDQGESSRTIVSPKSLYSGKNGLKIRNYDGTIWKNKEGKEWNQTNDEHESFNPPSYQIDLREAMRESVNSAYVQLGMDVGLDKVKEAAMSAGLLEGNFADSSYPSFSLGTSDPSAIRMADAYATFANSGQQNEPYSVTLVKHEGEKVYEHKKAPKSAFDPKVADNVTNVLKTVVDKGTGTHARLPGRDVAGKTGTTDGNKSAWFVGYTKQLSTAVTMFRFNDDANAKNRKFQEMYGTGGMKKVFGASFPTKIWHDYMAGAMAGLPKLPFPTPQPIGKVVGASPSPSPTPSVTASPSDTAPVSPSATPSSQPSPSTSQTCSKWDWTCNGTGGNGNGGNGGGAGGTTGGVTSSPSPSPSDTTGNTRGNGNSGGGLFGGGG
nr:transglycosylase domain-containing protein [Streptomyces beihaiensis]